MPSDAVVIGKVAVKVIPDTSGFRKKTQAKLDEIEAQLNKNPLEVQIVPTFDAAKARQIGTDIHKIVQASLRPVDVSVTFDDTGINAQIAALDKKLKGISDVIIGIDFGRGEIQAAEAELKHLTQDRNVNVDVDTKKAKLQLDALTKDRSASIKANMNKVASAASNVELKALTRDRDVSIKPVIDGKALAVAGGILARLSGGRILGEKFSFLASMIKDADMLAPKLATVGTGILGIGAAALSSAANVLSLGMSIASIAPAALALPGIFGGIAIGLAASAASLKDFNKYFPDFAIGAGKAAKAGQQWADLQNAMSDQFWREAAQPIGDMINVLFPKMSAGLITLSTSLGDFFGKLASGFKNALSPTIGKMFDKLTESVKIATGSTSGLASIIATLGTVGANYLPRLAQWFTDITNRFSNWLTKSEQSGKIYDWIDKAIQNLAALGDAIVQVGRIFGGLATAATNAGGSVLGTFSDTLKRIANAVNSPKFQKALTDVFRSAFDAMRNISDVAGPYVAVMLGSLGQSLTAILPQLGMTIGGIVAGISTAITATLPGLEAFFGYVHTAAQNLSPIWEPIGQAIGQVASSLGFLLTFMARLIASTANTLMPLINAILPPINQLIGILGNGLVTIMDGLEPIIISVGKAFGAFLSDAIVPLVNTITTALVPIAGSLAQVLGAALVGAFQVLTPLIQAVGPIFTEIVAALTPLLNAIVAGLSPALSTLGPLLTTLVQFFGDLAITILNGVSTYLPVMAQQFSQLLVAVLPIVTTLAEALIPIIQQMYPIFAQLMISIIPIVDMLVSGLAPIIPVLATAFQQLLAAIAPIVPVLIDALVPIIPILTTAFTQLVTALAPIIPVLVGALAPILPMIANAFVQVLNAVAPLIPALIAGLVPVLPMLANAFVQIATAVAPLLPKLMQFLVSIVMPLIPVVKDIASDYLPKFADALSGVADKAGPLIDSLQRLWNVISPVLIPVLKFLAQMLLDTVLMAINGVTNVISGVTKIINGIIDFIKNIFAGNWKAAWQSIKDIFAGVIQTIIGAIEIFLSVGIIGKFGAVLDFFKGLGGKILSGIGDLGSLLSGVGGKIIDSLIGGLKNAFGKVKDTLKGLTDLLPDWKGPASRDATLLTGAGTLIIDGFINGLESRYDAVKKSLGGLTKDIAGTDMGNLALPGVGTAGAVSAMANGSLSSGAAAPQRILNYYAADGSSISSEEDLFTAAGRSRMGAW